MASKSDIHELEDSQRVTEEAGNILDDFLPPQETSEVQKSHKVFVNKALLG